MHFNKIIPYVFFILLISIILSCKRVNNVISPNDTYDILAKSTSLEDVQAAVDSAESGDIVRIPIGQSTWLSRLEIPDDKKITLKGSGSNVTIISSDSLVPSSLINLGSSGSRITQMGFKLANNNGDGIRVRGIGWRIDHCRFDNMIDQTIEGVHARGSSRDDGSPIGLVDHCEFYNIRVIVTGDASLMAHGIWAQPLGLGTNNAMFIEDCFFDFTKFGNAIDANYGGRYVFRYNIVNDAYIEAHSVQGNNRATRSWEIYGNSINQVERSMWAPFFLRGGTGVVFNNTLTGNWSSGPSIVVDNRRSFQDLGDGGLCDGTSSWDGSSLEHL